MSDEKADVSNQTVAVLLVLTILVTIVGTWLVLDALTPASAAPSVDENQQQAEISFTLIKPPESLQEVAKVSFELITPQE